MIVAEREVRAALVARVAATGGRSATAVDMRDPQALAALVGLREAAGEKVAGRGKAIEFEREFGTLIPHR